MYSPLIALLEYLGTGRNLINNLTAGKALKRFKTHASCEHVCGPENIVRKTNIVFSLRPLTNLATISSTSNTSFAVSSNIMFLG